MLAELWWQCSTRIQATNIRRLFRRKVALSFERNQFLVKTIENGDELEQVLRLRYEVFHREYGLRKLPYGLDTEKYDLLADHLVIVDKSTQRIVGTYRLLCSAYTHEFYSQSEFQIDDFLKRPGTKLELSRACIHREYRKGLVMTLLWRGLVEYVREVGATYLFGCASVKTVQPSEAKAVARLIEEKGSLCGDLRATPHSSFLLPGFDDAEPSSCAQELLPSLLGAYLRAGAKIASRPALDRAFRCVDFFTVLDMRELAGEYQRKYAAC